ncbi:MAG: PqqD family protein [Gemmatimonadota bacterium]
MHHVATQPHPLLSASIRVPEDVVYREFASEMVVLNLKTGQYHGLNPTAGEMLKALDETRSVETASRQIADRHGVDLATVQRDICALCDRFVERGLISVEQGA